MRNKLCYSYCLPSDFKKNNSFYQNQVKIPQKLLYIPSNKDITAMELQYNKNYEVRFRGDHVLEVYDGNKMGVASRRRIGDIQIDLIPEVLEICKAADRLHIYGGVTYKIPLYLLTAEFDNERNRNGYITEKNGVFVFVPDIEVLDLIEHQK